MVSVAGVIDNACHIPPNGQALRHHVLISVKRTAASEGGEKKIKKGFAGVFLYRNSDNIVHGHRTGCVPPLSHKSLVS